MFAFQSFPTRFLSVYVCGKIPFCQIPSLFPFLSLHCVIKVQIFLKCKYLQDWNRAQASTALVASGLGMQAGDLQPGRAPPGQAQGLQRKARGRTAGRCCSFYSYSLITRCGLAVAVSLKAKAEEGRRDDDLRLGALRIVFEGVRTWEGSQAVEGVYRSVQQASIPAPAFGTSPPADWGDSYVNRQSLGGGNTDPIQRISGG